MALVVISLVLTALTSLIVLSVAGIASGFCPTVAPFVKAEGLVLALRLPGPLSTPSSPDGTALATDGPLGCVTRAETLANIFFHSTIITD